jgi:hypothetical protein
VVILPEFGPCWDSPDNCYRGEDGSFTLCGVFSEYSDFVREDYARLTVPQRADLARFLGECMTEMGTDLDNATATCFLENLSFEPFSRDFMQYLDGAALSFYRGFQGL